MADASEANPDENPMNPLEPSMSLRKPPQGTFREEAHPPQPQLPEDSAVTKAEKVERNGSNYRDADLSEIEQSPAKRIKLGKEGARLGESEVPRFDEQRAQESDAVAAKTTSGHARQKGIAPVKPEFLAYPTGSKQSRDTVTPNDDAAETLSYQQDGRNGQASAKKKVKSKGQNTSRKFGSSKDAVELCMSRATSSEFSPKECRFGTGCKFEHDIRRYLKEGKRDDLSTFNGLCPVWSVKGTCNVGWKCRFAGSHMQERDREDGQRELILIEDGSRKASSDHNGGGSSEAGVVNIVGTQQKMELMKRKMRTPQADAYTEWMDKSAKELEKQLHKGRKSEFQIDLQDGQKGGAGLVEDKVAIEDARAQYTEPPFLPSEKRRIYFGPETPVLAPLTTQGNLPFRRLCVSLGAQITYSEMAMGLPLIQGQKSEWALMKAHESEMTPPAFTSKGCIVAEYDNSKDFKFGAQIAANKPWQACKATEVLTALCPHLRVVDLNCGCPIDLVFRSGAGSALMDVQAKLEKIIRGMNAVSGDVPITVKIRTGTKDGKPTAQKLVERLAFGGHEANEIGEGASGVAAITLHGRSRQQRYTKSADWQYISECAALIESFNKKGDDLADTIQEADARAQPAGNKVYFVGNGDCYSHVDYNDHLQNAKVDSVMIARGALIKPWIFEEIEKGQYLDKSASERLTYVEQFARFGLETWGSDEMGIGTTRRFLLEWLSFAHRYVPVGILEHLPPSLQDRPPAWRGRSDLENLLGSDNYKDWIKISEMFLGPAHKDFSFAPKHKSNSYEIEAEG
ncbi:MAG: tRNA-dihydrouridine synthase 3 [Pycnora praestabilis]|nr:MAG: tRNA-dihydrouridine synthase 3 [Pycnora praestabilis]